MTVLWDLLEGEDGGEARDGHHSKAHLIGSEPRLTPDGQPDKSLSYPANSFMRKWKVWAGLKDRRHRVSLPFIPRSD